MSAPLAGGQHALPTQVFPLEDARAGARIGIRRRRSFDGIIVGCLAGNDARDGDGDGR